MARVLIGNVRTPIEYLEKFFAPSGFGLGEPYGKRVLWSEVDNAKEFGNWGIWGDEGVKTIDGFQFWYAKLLVLPMDANAVTQILFPLSDTGLVLFRSSLDDKWGEWEWLDPPMAPDVEYRTTETWYGFPVYTVLIGTGGLTDAKNVVTTNIDAHRIVRQSASIEAFCLPHIDGTLDAANSAWVNAAISSGKIELTFHVGSALRGKSAGVQLWYIKEGGI